MSQQIRFVGREKLSSEDKQTSWEQDDTVPINLSKERKQKKVGGQKKKQS